MRLEYYRGYLKLAEAESQASIMQAEVFRSFLLPFTGKKFKSKKAVPGVPSQRVESTRILLSMVCHVFTTTC